MTTVGLSLRKWGLAIAVAGAILLFSIGEPYFSAHYFRQAQTLETASFFSQLGFDFFNPRVGYRGKPGILALEAPFYQAAIHFLKGATGLSPESIGRFISGLFAIAFALIATSFLISVLGKKNAATTNNTILSFEKVFPLILSTPLLFGMGQWVTIENLHLASGTFSLFSMIQFFRTETKREQISWIIAYVVAATFSLLIKPTTMFALASLFVYFFFFSNKVRLNKKILVIMGAIFATTIALLWIRHSNQVNHSWGNSVSYTAHFTWYRSLLEYTSIENTLKITGRLFLYTVGPGTLAVLGICLLFSETPPKTRTNYYLVVSAIIGIGSFFLFFVSVSSAHNYYQSAIIPLTLILIFAPLAGRKIKAPIKPLLVLGIGLNVIVAQTQLAKQVRSWPAVIKELKIRIPAGYDRPELLLFTNIEAANPTLSYELGRFLKPLSLHSVTDENQPPAWLALCGPPKLSDLADQQQCILNVSQKFPTCRISSETIENFWICFGV